MIQILIWFIIAILNPILFVRYQTKKTKRSLGVKTSNIIKVTHYVGLIICCAIAYSYVDSGIGLRGLWTTPIIIITTFSIGFFFIFVCNKEVLNMDVFEKQGIFEKHLAKLDLHAIDSVKVSYDADSTRISIYRIDFEGCSEIEIVSLEK